MKKALSIASAMMLAVVSAAAQGSLPNFSGTWNLDAAKSDFGPLPPPSAIVMVIDHKEPTLKVTVTQKGPQGDVSNESTYTTNGANNVNSMRSPDGDQPVTSTTRWTGKTLTTMRTIEAQGMRIAVDDSWELSADGRVLTINRQLKTPQGDFGTRTVLNKQ